MSSSKLGDPDSKPIGSGHRINYALPTGSKRPVNYLKAMEGLKDADPEMRRLSAEILGKCGSTEALAALREANTSESIVDCKTEIVRAIVSLEQRLAPLATTA